MRDDEFKEFLQSIDQARTMSYYWRALIWMRRIVHSPWFWFGFATAIIIIGFMIH